jgi:hypothetical protein
MLPYFFRHYDAIVDRYFVYDNGSTDQSLMLLGQHDKVSLRHFDVAGDSFVEEERRLSDTVWKESRGSADWVIVLDIDEHVFHPDLPTYLRRCTDSNVTALRGIGYEMVADHFPADDRKLVESVTIGARSAGHDKLCIFNPDALTQSNFRPGRHLADPEGRVTWPDQPEMLLLHYKQLGVEYAIKRSSELRLGLGTGDMNHRWGVQYLWSEAEIADRWSKLRAAASAVPGLGSLKDVAPRYYDEEHVVAESGLMDSGWYLAAYPDIKAAGANALSHFCIHGWKEGRRPNFYFHPDWYRDRYPEARAGGGNPLVHYIVGGESDGAQPSPYFDTQWYRRRYALDHAQSPLQHYLLRRGDGHVSPLPTFDVAAYLRDFPQREAGFQDPFEEYCWRSSLPPPRPESGAALPSFRDVVSVLGIDPRAESGVVTVDAAALLAIIKRFLEIAVVDEERYCSAYPDVAAAILAGAIASARDHFMESGYFEGRCPTPL